MPGQHDPLKYKFVGLWLSEDVVSKVDGARAELNRSQFLRDALQEKLTAMNILVERDEVVAPDRAGKGGPRPKKIASYRAEARQARRKKRAGHDDL